MSAARRHVVVGTAGHIDHGKTSLVKALTGTDTDRLPEEKARGITIDLGFAFLEEPDGLTIEVVDVPGHERFVKNMLAGVGGIDLAMLVIAADEGVMPQTREHLAICSLLHIRTGLVVLTKTDTVESDWIELVRDDVATLVRGTFLEGAPVVPVSAKTGAGLDELRATLRRLAATVPARGTDQLPRLPIDRVFTIKGFGTVVTGTLAAGALGVDDRVEVFPRGLVAKIRGLQAHGHAVERSVAGQRTAVNLQGLERAAVERGDVIGMAGTLSATTLADVVLEILHDAPRPLKSRDRVRLHAGTSEIMARALLLEGAELAPGKRGFARLRLEAPLVALAGDRFVIRSYSPIVTIGGGTLLDTDPPRLKRPARLAHLNVLESGAPEAVVEEHVRGAGVGGIRLPALVARVPFGPARTRRLLDALAAAGRVTAVDRDWSLHADAVARLRGLVTAALEQFHRAQPLRGGMSREELRVRAANADERVFAHVLGALDAEGAVRVDRDKVRLAAHELRLSAVQQTAVDRLEREFREAAAAPPSAEEALGRAGLAGDEEHELFQLLVESRKLVRVKESLFFHAAALEAIQDKLVALLRERKEIGPGDVKDLLGISRKYAIPLLEYFDARRVTTRVGERRVLRGG
ncbi:MAG: selenocysteine-specific translation elongation factor [Candidatus Rokuibacteriota bacterium]|nr:MAG: selenocysteine-specific translation elongation factor [Candidatus Rokubacteria bacterium]PYN28264.1 MAG: selenocysteine-specific translation elongation factor [Candidatus Rokubacteria bacterium]